MTFSQRSRAVTVGEAGIGWWGSCSWCGYRGWQLLKLRSYVEASSTLLCSDGCLLKWVTEGCCVAAE